MYSYNNKYVHRSMMPGTLIVQHVTLCHESPVTRLLEVASCRRIHDVQKYVRISRMLSSLVHAQAQFLLFI